MRFKISCRQRTLQSVRGFGIPVAYVLLLMALATYVGTAAAQSSSASRAPSSRNGATLWVQVTQRIKVKIWTSAGAVTSPTLIVVVHGDSPNGPPTYHYKFAEAVAAALDNVVVAAVLRPGYEDGEDRSDGMRGETTGDNYTPEVLSAVAAIIADLRGRYHPGRTVLVGHSGGAAIVGGMIGQPDRIADAALLVSCPCDLAAWRDHMFRTKGGRIWQRSERSLSPLALARNVPLSTAVRILIGAEDPITPPVLSQQYVDELRARGIQAKLSVAPSLSHNILLEPIVLDELKAIVSSLTPTK